MPETPAPDPHARALVAVDELDAALKALDAPDPHARALDAVDELDAALKALELPYLGKPATLAVAHQKPLKAVRESVELHRDQQARQ